LISCRQLNRAFLARRLLPERADLTVERAITHLVGIKAQAPHPSYLGLWTRFRRFGLDDPAQLVPDRRVVRLALMRHQR